MVEAVEATKRVRLRSSGVWVPDLEERPRSSSVGGDSAGGGSSAASNGGAVGRLGSSGGGDKIINRPTQPSPVRYDAKPLRMADDSGLQRLNGGIFLMAVAARYAAPRYNKMIGGTLSRSLSVPAGGSSRSSSYYSAPAPVIAPVSAASPSGWLTPTLLSLALLLGAALSLLLLSLDADSSIVSEFPTWLCFIGLGYCS